MISTLLVAVSTVVYLSLAMFGGLVAYNDYLSPGMILLLSVGWPLFALYVVGAKIFA